MMFIFTLILPIYGSFLPKIFQKIPYVSNIIGTKESPSETILGDVNLINFSELSDTKKQEIYGFHTLDPQAVNSVASEVNYCLYYSTIFYQLSGLNLPHDNQAFETYSLELVDKFLQEKKPYPNNFICAPVLDLIFDKLFTSQLNFINEASLHSYLNTIYQIFKINESKLISNDDPNVKAANNSSNIFSRIFSDLFCALCHAEQISKTHSKEYSDLSKKLCHFVANLESNILGQKQKSPSRTSQKNLEYIQNTDLGFNLEIFKKIKSSCVIFEYELKLICENILNNDNSHINLYISNRLLAFHSLLKVLGSFNVYIRASDTNVHLSTEFLENLKSAYAHYILTFLDYSTSHIDSIKFVNDKTSTTFSSPFQIASSLSASIQRSLKSHREVKNCKEFNPYDKSFHTDEIYKRALDDYYTLLFPNVLNHMISGLFDAGFLSSYLNFLNTSSKRKIFSQEIIKYCIQTIRKREFSIKEVDFYSDLYTRFSKSLSEDIDSSLKNFKIGNLPVKTFKTYKIKTLNELNNGLKEKAQIFNNLNKPIQVKGGGESESSSFEIFSKVLFYISAMTAIALSSFFIYRQVQKQ